MLTIAPDTMTIPAAAPAIPQVVHDLRTQIERIERTAHPRREGVTSSGFPALDTLLPGGGFTGGTLVEWIGAGQGGLTLALLIAARLTHGRAIAVVGDRIYPPAAAALGVPLERTIVVRPPDARMNFWAWEQSLRCEGIAVTLGRLREANEGVMRRLQQASAAGGGVGFVIRDKDCQTATMWADLRLRVRPVPEAEQPGWGEGWRLRVEMLRVRGSFAGGSVILDV